MVATVFILVLLLFFSPIISGCINFTVTRTSRKIDDIARTTRVLAITLEAIKRKLNTMPTISDLTNATNDAKAAVDAAALRVIDAQGSPVPQESIDAISAIKTDADAISPA